MSFCSFLPICSFEVEGGPWEVRKIVIKEKDMKYNKLVRDKIPEYIKSKGGTPITHIANDKECWVKLKEKLLEEIKEFSESETIEEMADIQEAIDAICSYKKFNRKKIEVVRKKKVKERGAFKKKIILEES